ncbi:hypothetical protein [Streptomyces sp. MA5143a]|uniref:hypothetical protein n=1 Tax=Streptomyces sp. MA5143a TaxID=2083010 RepID=UPI0011B2771A|nr:hypothetical protein [Streptomyces sp. MA5143a]
MSDAEETRTGRRPAAVAKTVVREGTVGDEPIGPRARLPRPAALAAPAARTRGGGAWRSTWTRTS